METPYSRITEIREAPTPEAANDLLKQGFVLVKVLEKYTNDTDRQFSNIVYVLGRQRFNGESHAAPEKNSPSNSQPTTPAPPTVDSALLDKRPWKEYSNGGGQWTFYMDRVQDQGQVPQEVPRRRSAEVGAGGLFRVSKRRDSASCRAIHPGRTDHYSPNSLAGTGQFRAREDSAALLVEATP
jgi:hypothetical protein